MGKADRRMVSLIKMNEDDFLLFSSWSSANEDMLNAKETYYSMAGSMIFHFIALKYGHSVVPKMIYSAHNKLLLKARNTL